MDGKREQLSPKASHLQVFSLTSGRQHLMSKQFLSLTKCLFHCVILLHYVSIPRKKNIEQNAIQSQNNMQAFQDTFLQKKKRLQ